MKILLGAIQMFFTFVIGMSSLSAWADPRPEVMARSMVQVIEKMRWSSRCENFVNSDQIGSYGQYILKTINRVSFPELYHSNADLEEACPNFDNLRDSEKDYVWVMFLTSVAFYESTCNPNASAAGPNGIAQGLMQLHLNKEHFYSVSCVRGDSLYANLTLHCSLSMLNDQIRRDQALFSLDSYWEVLKPLSRQAQNISLVLKNFSLCQKR